VPAETFLRDIRIGLRILIKERSFCALAVIVLALGICGVTTMFSVVNGVMLRGFSFPTADRLASASFIDPSSANFFGVNGQVSSMDFDELLPQADITIIKEDKEPDAKWDAEYAAGTAKARDY